MKLLSYGSTGPMVELLQSVLKKLGYYNGKIDGIYGAMTVDAVKRFQSDNRIKADGIVGPQTWTYLMPFVVGYMSYTIKSGDTLYNLSQKYNSTVNLILTANPNINPNNLTVGQRIIIPFRGSYIQTDISYTYPIMELNIRSLAVRFPFITTSSIGKSVMGNQLYLLKIGTGSKHVSYNASHHANEWITSPVLMKYIEELALAYINNASVYGYSAKEILSNTTIYFIPMVNPDGVNLVTGELTPDSAYYQYALSINDPGIPFPDGWKANISGTDLNVNYPAMWETAKEIKYAEGYTSPGPREFVGPYPLSEPESKAMADFTKNNNFRLVIAYHTQGEEIYYQFADYNPPQSYEIAQAFSKASGYPAVETPYESAFAGYKDWFIQEYNRPGYTIEAGKGENPLPISQFGQIYKDNVPILTLGAIL